MFRLIIWPNFTRIGPTGPKKKKPGPRVQPWSQMSHSHTRPLSWRLGPAVVFIKPGWIQVPRPAKSGLDLGFETQTRSRTGSHVPAWICIVDCPMSRSTGPDIKWIRCIRCPLYTFTWAMDSNELGSAQNHNVSWSGSDSDTESTAWFWVRLRIYNTGARAGYRSGSLSSAATNFKASFLF